MPYSKLRRLLRHVAVVAVACIFETAYAEGSPPAEGRPADYVVTLPFKKDVQEHLSYLYDVLELALSKTADTDGISRVKSFPEALTIARMFNKLQKNDGLDVIWSTSNADLEKRLLRDPYHCCAASTVSVSFSSGRRTKKNLPVFRR